MALNNLLKKLKKDYPHFSFQPSDMFRWSPSKVTIFYDPSGAEIDLLHELSHALLKHSRYHQDIELLQKEREAWEYTATQLAPIYSIATDEAHVEESMESYRAWLHARSQCPQCHETGIQKTNSAYYCAICQSQWRTNDGRLCALRRFQI